MNDDPILYFILDSLFYDLYCLMNLEKENIHI